MPEPSAGLPANGSEGMAFECWIAHALVGLGARQAQWGVSVSDSLGSSMIEFDAVACCGVRLLVLDLKLTGQDAAGKTAELRTAQQTAQWIGGRSAQVAVVRPNWRSSPPVREAAQQMEVQLVVRDNLAELPRLVQRCLGVTSTATQRALADALAGLLALAVRRAPPEAAVLAHVSGRPARRPPQPPQAHGRPPAAPQGAPASTPPGEAPAW
jgi:hypothetical protein